MPTVDVDSAPTVGVFVNDQWRAVLLSLVARADNPTVWANENDLDRIEQNAYKLYEAIRNPLEPEGRMKHIGEPFMLFVETAPADCLPMDGVGRLQSAYPELMPNIPSLWKAGEYFYLPNMASRGLFGAGQWWDLATGQYYSMPVGGVSGEIKHQLLTQEIPAHGHQQVSAAGVGLVVDNNSTGWQTLGSVGTAGQPATPLLTKETGGGEYHNNMPPYVLGYWYIQVI